MESMESMEASSVPNIAARLVVKLRYNASKAHVSTRRTQDSYATVILRWD